MRAAPLYDGREEVAGAIESIRDITEQRRAKEVLKKERIFTNTALEIL
ncbi:MAG: hypothetical protein PHT97_00895 [Methanoculleus sp.]|nr:hypothetical protein [Methanoculleus sp.]MDD2255350.1 hypothetical protein [Methanoculleus sp.]MDD4314085.1 hypothetical protein [Methanoculleus sp.]MDD4469699.1 hypothetical protein [Methanoculleus sp.]